MMDRSRYSRLGAHEAQSVERVVHALLDAPRPADAVSSVIEWGAEEGATCFERYASMALRRAGGLRLGASQRFGALKLVKPQDGRLALIVDPKRTNRKLEPSLLATECALNRIICLADALTDGRSACNPRNPAPRRSISILGGGFLSTNAGWRSARVILPDPIETCGITARYYNEVDWRTTDCVASNARAIFQRSLRPNAYRRSFGVNAAAQGSWDVRTRLAQLLESLELPHRYGFRFDYDDTENAVYAVFTCPPKSFLPMMLDDDGACASEPDDAAYQCYLIRLACLFSAACFGSGRGIEQAGVIGFDPSWSEPLVSARFDRDDFVRSALVHIDADALSDPALRFDPQAVADLLCARFLEWRGRSGSPLAASASLPESGFGFERIDPLLDTRPLLQDAQELFHCRSICDAYAGRYFGGHADAVDLARGDCGASPLAAVLRLESLVDELESALEAPAHDASARPLFAKDPLSRLAIGLLDDEMAVAAQAQAYLRGESEPLSGDCAPPSYFRAPDALFHAHFGLSCLYQELGDYQLAESHADRCITLAPTTANAYYRKADVIAEQGRFDHAANILIAGLRNASSSADSGLLYFHLGMLLWNLGEKEKAAAVHVYNAALSSEYAEKSKRIVAGLRQKPDAPSVVFEKPFSIHRTLQQMGLPLAPVDLRPQIAQAAILLADSGSPSAAAPYAKLLERQCNDDEVLVAACRSIQYGLAL